MSKLIIVCGLAGTGKTTLSTELSRKLKIVCIHKDSIKETLFDSFNYSTLDDSKQLGKPSVDVMFYLAQQQMENGIDVIIEAPFNFPEDHRLFKSWQNKYSIKIYSIICSISKEERKRRIKERERHHAHHDVDRQLYDSVDSLEYDYKVFPGKQIRVETSRSIQDLIEYIAPQLK